MRTLTLGLFALIALLAAPSALAQLPSAAQGYLGRWQTVDDETGETKSIVEIYEQNGKAFGRIVRLLPTASNPNAICSPCASDYEGSNMQGVVILRDMEWNVGDNQFSGGTIRDPKTGRTYRCKMSLDGPTQLRVRGFIGVSLIGRTQVWRRAQ